MGVGNALFMEQRRLATARRGAVRRRGGRRGSSGERETILLCVVVFGYITIGVFLVES